MEHITWSIKRFLPHQIKKQFKQREAVSTSCSGCKHSKYHHDTGSGKCQSRDKCNCKQYEPSDINQTSESEGQGESTKTTTDTQESALSRQQDAMPELSKPNTHDEEEIKP